MWPLLSDLEDSESDGKHGVLISEARIDPASPLRPVPSHPGGGGRGEGAPQDQPRFRTRWGLCPGKTTEKYQACTLQSLSLFSGLASVQWLHKHLFQMVAPRQVPLGLINTVLVYFIQKLPLKSPARVTLESPERMFEYNMAWG